MIRDTLLAWGAGRPGPWRDLAGTVSTLTELCNTATFLALTDEDPTEVREALEGLLDGLMSAS